MTKKVKEFAEFFAKQDPEKIIPALKFLNDLQEKNISELELSIKLTNNPRIKKIIKEIIKIKIDRL